MSIPLLKAAFPRKNWHVSPEVAFSKDDTRMSPTRVAKKSMDQFVRRCKQTHQSHKIYPGPVTGKTMKCPKKDHEVT